MPREKKQKLKKRADGRYACRYKDQWFYSTDPDDCLRQREEYKAAERVGDVYRPTVTLKEYAEQWLPIAHPDVADATYRGLAIHLEKLVRQLGDQFLSEIKPLQIKEVYNKEYLGLSNSYILAAKQLYSALFDSAVENGLRRSNPARSKDATPPKGTTGGHRAITDEERYWIENLCTDHRAHAAVITMLYSGIRPQEAKALDIDKAVDFKKGVIHVMETAHYSGYNSYVITEQGKTKNAIRDIPLFPPVRAVLEGKHGLLITSESGEQCTPTIWKKIMLSYRHQMEEAINGRLRRWYGRTREDQALIARGGKMAPWKPFNVVPYDLRHSFCTMCRDNGVELNTCIHWMGHADATMIMKIYDEVRNNRSAKEAQKLEKILFGSQNGSQKKRKSLKVLENKGA